MAVLDSDVAPLLQKAFELYATEFYSFKELSAHLCKHGLMTAKGTALSPGYLQNMLANRFYVGEIVWKGETFKGVHEPPVSKDLFAAVQSVMLRKRRDMPYRSTRLHFWLRGLARCGSCGGKMTAERHGEFRSRARQNTIPSTLEGI
jgi:site-specific DNA recombinase